MEGTGQALKVRKVAEGVADAARTEAQGRADAIRMVSDAAKEAGQNPLFLEIRNIEVKLAIVDKWDGSYPNVMTTMGGENLPNLLMQMPIPSK